MSDHHPDTAPDPGRPSPPPPAPTGTPAAHVPSEGAVTVGRIVEVTVTSVSPAEVEVRLADGRPGVVPGSEVAGPVAVGDTVPIALLARDDPAGRVVGSLAWARKQLAWERVDTALAGKTPVTGTVTSTVKGGAVVDLGVRAFLPSSLAGDAAGGDLSTLVGSEVEVLVVEADRSKDRVVVSIRDLQRRRRRAAEKERLGSLEVGSTVTGRVAEIVEHGVIVDLGGVRGLVHRSELTWGHLGRIDEIVSVGDEVEVVVLDVNRSRRRVGLSLRATSTDPLGSIEVGAVASATATRVVDYGVFARLDDSGAEGLVHISELSDVPGMRPDQMVVPGEQIMVKVLDVDLRRRRLGLSVRRVLSDDWGTP